MLDRMGLRVLRLNMDAYIKSDPIMLQIERRVREQTANNGWRMGAPQEKDPQQFRILPFKRRLSEFMVNTQDGEIPRADFILIGRWNVDIERWDSFMYNGDKYMVVSIEMKSNDRLKTDRVVAQVVGYQKGLPWQTAAGFSS